MRNKYIHLLLLTSIIAIVIVALTVIVHAITGPGCGGAGGAAGAAGGAGCTSGRGNPGGAGGVAGGGTGGNGSFTSNINTGGTFGAGGGGGGGGFTGANGGTGGRGGDLDNLDSGGSWAGNGGNGGTGGNNNAGPAGIGGTGGIGGDLLNNESGGSSGGTGGIGGPGGVGLPSGTGGAGGKGGGLHRLGGGGSVAGDGGAGGVGGAGLGSNGGANGGQGGDGGNASGAFPVLGGRGGPGGAGGAGCGGPGEVGQPGSGTFSTIGGTGGAGGLGGPACTPPPAPTVTPSCTANAPSFTVNWNNAPGLTPTSFTVDVDDDNYNGGWIYRNVSSAGGPYSTTGPNGFAGFGASPPAIPLSEGSTYQVRINYRAASSTGSDVYSAVQTFVTPNNCSPPAPPPPPMVTPVCNGGASSVKVDWNDGGTQGNSGYYVDIDDNANWSDGGWNRSYPAGTITATVDQFTGNFNGSNGSLRITQGQTYTIRIYYVASGLHSATPDKVFQALNCDRPPVITAVPNCPARGIDVSVTDPDGGTSTVNYQIGSNPPSSRTANSFTIDMTGVNQYVVTSVSISTVGVAQPGSITGAAVSVNPPVSYGPCQNRTFLITPTAVTTLDDDENPTSATFTNWFTITYSPAPTPPDDGPGVKLTATRRYYIKRLSGATTDLGSPPADTNGGAPFTHPVGGRFDYSPAEPVTRSLLGQGIVPGDQICDSFTVTPREGEVDDSGNPTPIPAGPGNTISSERCMPVVNKPYFRIYGGDVLAGASGFDTMCSPNPTGMILAFNRNDGAGSAGQLATMAMDRIEEFSSATGRTSNPVPKKGLSFANITAAEPYGGNLDYAPCNKDYYGTVSSTTPTALGPSSNVSSLTGPSYVRTGNLRLSGGVGTVLAGEKIVIYVDGDVLIDQDITYDPAGWTEPKQIPSLYLVAKGDIYVHADVTRLDGTYVAQPDGAGGGRIFTCADRQANNPKPVELTNANYDFSDFCDTQLVINGAFIAKRTHLLRTKGSLRDSSPGEAAGSSTIAEVFNFSPESWLSFAPIIPPPTATIDYDSVISPPPVL